MASGVQIEKWFKQGFELYKNSAGILIPACLLAFLISSLTLGILAGPMIAGLLMLGLRLHDRSDPSPEIGDLFKGFDHFKDAFLLTLIAAGAMILAAIVLSWVPLIGGLVTYVFSALVALIVWFAMALVLEKGMTFWPAAQAAMDRIKSDFWPFLAFAVLIAFVSGLGSIFCIIGICLTMPLYVSAVTIAYRDTWDEEGAAKLPEPPTRPEEAAPAPPPEEDAPTAEPEAETGPDGDSEAKPPASS